MHTSEVNVSEVNPSDLAGIEVDITIYSGHPAEYRYIEIGKNIIECMDDRGAGWKVPEWVEFEGWLNESAKASLGVDAKKALRCTVVPGYKELFAEVCRHFKSPSTAVMFCRSWAEFAGMKNLFDVTTKGCVNYHTGDPAFPGDNHYLTHDESLISWEERLQSGCLPHISDDSRAPSWRQPVILDKRKCCNAVV
jgi:hypothetical protein